MRDPSSCTLRAGLTDYKFCCQGLIMVLFHILHISLVAQNLVLFTRHGDYRSISEF